MTDAPSGDDAGEDPFDALLERAARLTPLPRTSTPILHPGLELCDGRLQVLRRLGAGGMGVVYEALDRRRGDVVALKTLSRVDPAGIYRLKNEFRALSEVVHPNLVRLHELFADGELWLFTMELVRGEPWDEWVRPGDVRDEARVRAALPQLALGVQAIHSAGKLHRDLKPSNVLCTPEGRVVILDFGLIAERAAPERCADDDPLSGTPEYMAPEQAAGAPATAASDWYAVGVMLFEALWGRLPFDGKTHELLRRKQIERAPRPSGALSGAAADLSALCDGLLERQPAARPDGAAVVAALQAEVPSSPPARAHGATLLGRERELDALRDAFGAARAGTPLLLRISGDSGMGKSALVSSFVEGLRTAGEALVLCGRCYERESLPYKAFDRVVDELSVHLLKLPSASAAALLPRDAAALARIFPVLERSPAVADVPQHFVSDQGAQRRRAFQAFAELLAALRARQPVVVFIDDLQWIDHDSLLLFDHLLGLPEPPALLCIVGQTRSQGDAGAAFARIESAARANPRIELRDLEIGPLPLAATRALASQLLAGVPDAGPLSEAVARESHGSPFFAGELARYAARGGVARTEPQVSLEQAIHGRIAHLGAPARRLIELLALAGRPTPGEVLVRAAGPLEDPYRALDELRAAQLVRDGRERSYECYHDRIRVAVGERIAKDAARAQHKQLAAAWRERAGADPEVLFEHSRLAGELEHAGGYAVQAAEKAHASLAFERSAAFLAHAIELLPEAEVTRLVLAERHAEALSLAGRWAEAARAYEQAGLRTSDVARSSELLGNAAVHYLGSGRTAQGLPRLRQVFLAQRVRWPRSKPAALAAALARLFWLWLSRARRPQRPRSVTAEQLAQLDRLFEGASLVPLHDATRGLYFVSAFAERALRHGDTARAAVALGMLSAIFMVLRPTRGFARRLSQEACALARAPEVPKNLACAALNFAAFGRVVDGALPEALALAAEAEALLGQTPVAHNYEAWSARALHGCALLLLGRVAEAAAKFEQNAQRARETGDLLAEVGGNLSLRQLIADDAPRARALLERKQALLPASGEPGLFHQIIAFEQLLCALYEGRGAEHLRALSQDGGPPLRILETSVLVAFCALQARDDTPAEARRQVQRALRGLRGATGPGNAAIKAQLRAAICLLDGEQQQARTELAAAAESYAAAGMALHAALMRMREGRLHGDAAGVARAAEAEAALRAYGLQRPEAWAHMLAPGLEPRGAQSSSR